VETCWTLVRQSAQGDAAARDRFAEAYLPVVRAYLADRWKASPMIAETDDAVQETFMECFREQGALGKVDLSGQRPFRTFLYAVSINVARRFEERRQLTRRQGEPDVDVPSDDPRASQAFDRRWAQAILRRAAARQEREATSPDAKRRVDLLRQRFQEGKPIRKIAEAWNVDAAELHHEFAKAREEFRAALIAEIAWHEAGASPERLEAECRRVLESLA
jgi:RNA polymerase sigma-70 factor (ECF subfamily)